MLQHSVHLKPYVKLQIRICKVLYGALKLISKGTCSIHCIALYCIVLYCIVLYCIALHCIALHYTALHCTALHCIALYCIMRPYTEIRLDRYRIGVPWGLSEIRTKPWLSDGSLTCDPCHHRGPIF